jgi:hypothetical protein
MVAELRAAGRGIYPINPVVRDGPRRDHVARPGRAVPTMSDQDCTNGGGSSESFGSQTVCQRGQGHSGEVVPNDQLYPNKRDNQRPRQNLHQGR